MMMLIGLGLASAWESQPSIATWGSGKQAVTLVLLMGAIGSEIVVTKGVYGYRYRLDRCQPIVDRTS